MSLIQDIFCKHCASQGLVKKRSNGKTYYYCKVCRKRTYKQIYTEPQILPKPRVTAIKRSKRFIITSAVNDTALVQDAHKLFEKMQDRLGACYLVLPGVYKNPDLAHQGAQHGYKWPEDILPYVCNADIDLNSSLKVCGKTRITYTSINPLNGLNASSSTQSEIFGHPQLALQSIATPYRKMAKTLRTTMSISQPNYGDSVTAKKAEAHHKIGALFVEVEGDKFWTTELCYDGQGVYLYDTYHTLKSAKKVKSVPGVVLGDIHTRWLTDKTKGIFKHIVKKFGPQAVVTHDVHDHHIGSHHSKNDIAFNLSKSLINEVSVKKELMLSVAFLDSLPNPFVVESNHHRHLNQWFDSFKPNCGDNVNLALYFELGTLMLQDLEKGGDGNLFRLFITKYCKNNVTFIGSSDAYSIKNIDVSNHGDRGPNGCRGSLNAFAKCGVPVIIGHGHGPGINKLAWQVGVSSLFIPYAKGFGNWDMWHSIIFDNGERASFNVVYGKLSPILR